jgi:hypothetical protein
VESTAGAVVLAVGAAADPIGAGGWAFLDRVGVADAVRVAPPVGEVAGAVAVSMGAVGDAWPPEGAVGCSEGLALAVAV